MSLVRLGQGMSMPANKPEFTKVTIPEATYINASPSFGVEPIAGFNGAQGTIYLNYEDTSANIGNDSVIMTISDGTSNNRIFIQKRVSQGGRFRVASIANGQTNEIWDGFLSTFPNGAHNLALSWDASNLRVFVNGMVLCKIEGNFVNGIFSQLDLGQLNGGGFTFNGTPNECRYYDTILSEAQGALLTRNNMILDGITFDPNRKIYMFMGQSNSVGQGVGTASYTNTSQMALLSNAMTVGTYSDAYTDPAGSLIKALDDANGNYNTGYAGYFADTLSQLSGGGITVCPANISGSSFDGATATWRVDAPSYRTSGTKITGMTASATGALHQISMAAQFGTIEAVIWGQGEGDATAGTSQADYQNYLSDLMDATRDVVGNDHLDWFNVGMPAYTTSIASTQASYNAIINAQKAIADNDPNAYFVIGTDVAGNPSDRVHYDLAGYETVGQMIANNVYNTQVMPETLYSTDGTERTIDVTGAPYLDDNVGFMWVQITSNNTPTGNEYPLILDDGSTSNVVGIRFYNGQPYGGYWVRGNSSNLGSFHMSSSGVPAFTDGARRTIGLSWNNITGQAYIYSGGFIREVDISAQDITGLNRLSVVSRAGSNPLDGAVHAFEIGNQFLTPLELEQRIQSHVNRTVIAGAGQSLELGALNSQETGGDDGYQALISTFAALNPEQEVLYYGRGEGGASLFKQNNSVSEYWWDEDTDTPGTMLQRLYDELDEFGVVPTHLSWAQGEQDALFLNQGGRPSKADYKEKLQLLFEDVRARYGDVQIYIKLIGRRTSGNNNDGGTQDIRDVQMELISELAYVHFAADQYQVPLFDDVHPTDAGYVEIFTQQAQSMVGNATYPSIVSTNVTANIVTVTLSSDVNLLENSVVDGFTYIGSDGNEIVVANAVGTGNVVTLTLASTPIDTNGTLYYIYDDVSSLNISNVIRSNDINVYPLQSSIIDNV